MAKSPESSDAEFLDGQILIAMPGMSDPRFSHSIVYLCAHSEDGAMGLLKGMMHPDAQSGVLYGPKNSGTKGNPVINKPKHYENDPAAISMLWRTSEAATGVTFSI